ncbi:hypothetical protein YB2330_000992 [Saitoella coloradoensis]
MDEYPEVDPLTTPPPFYSQAPANNQLIVPTFGIVPPTPGHVTPVPSPNPIPTAMNRNRRPSAYELMPQGSHSGVISLQTPGPSATSTFDPSHAHAHAHPRRPSLSAVQTLHTEPNIHDPNPDLSSLGAQRRPSAYELAPHGSHSGVIPTRSLSSTGIPYSQTFERRYAVISLLVRPISGPDDPSYVNHKHHNEFSEKERDGRIRGRDIEAEKEAEKERAKEREAEKKRKGSWMRRKSSAASAISVGSSIGAGRTDSVVATGFGYGARGNWERRESAVSTTSSQGTSPLGPGRRESSGTAPGQFPVVDRDSGIAASSVTPGTSPESPSNTASAQRRPSGVGMLGVIGRRFSNESTGSNSSANAGAGRKGSVASVEGEKKKGGKWWAGKLP